MTYACVSVLGVHVVYKTECVGRYIDEYAVAGSRLL